MSEDEAIKLAELGKETEFLKYRIEKLEERVAVVEEFDREMKSDSQKVQKTFVNWAGLAAGLVGILSATGVMIWRIVNGQDPFK